MLQGIVPVDRKTLGGEVSAGVTLAALAIPAGMGYASLAGMPVVTGLYTIALPMIAFALLGSSRHLVVGADSATAVVMAAGLAGLATAGSDEYIGLAGLLAVMAGVLLIVARLIRLGFIADFLSRTVLIGFLTGVGVQVACGQIAGMLGVSKGDGVTIGGHQFTNTIATLVSTVDHLGDISWTTVGVSAASLAVISGLGLVTDKIPAELLVVVGSIFVSWQWDLSSHGVSTVGSLAGGFPPIGIPDVSWSDIPTLSATSVSILVLILAQSAATSRAYAAKYNDHFDENVDLVGVRDVIGKEGLDRVFEVLRMPFMILAPLIFVLCFVGGYAPDTRMFDPWLILLFGFVGYVMRKLDYPLAPLVLAIVLGPLAENSFRQTMIADLGDWTVFFTRPLSGIIMGLAILLFIAPFLKRFLSRGKTSTLET